MIFCEYIKANKIGFPMRAIGPAPCTLEMINNRYRYRLILKTKNCKGFRDMIRFLLESFYKNRDGSWIDCWNDDPDQSLGNVRIKAYTKFVSYSSVKSPVNNLDPDTVEKSLEFIRLGDEDTNKPAPNF